MYQELFNEQEGHRFTPGLPGKGFGCCNEGEGRRVSPALQEKRMDV